MKKSLLVGTFVALAATASVPTFAQDYSITMYDVVHPATVDATGSFHWDATTNTFSNFMVSWDNLTLDMTDGANLETVLGHPFGTACGNGPDAAFRFLTTPSCQNQRGIGWYGVLYGVGPSNSPYSPTGSFEFFSTDYGEIQLNFQNATNFGSTGWPTNGNCPGYQCQNGNFSAAIESTSATPEPTSLALVSTGLFGIGAAFRRRKRTT